eukprot:TRINITY_DN5615_c0_g1_i2.p1 TRINITY_DN5615_c0_g1~~TRINITY_DN5615_c0_g1_i2.p1  ORF type:complete len:321 (+),score=143.02 TRINITY_DN5615_c0_g1_i2:122-1084(+)
MPDQSSKALVYIFGALAVTTSTYAYVRWSAGAKRRAPPKEEGVEELPRVPKDKVAEFFDVIIENMTKAIMALEAQLAQYRGQVPREQLAQVMLQQFEEQLQQQQDALLKKWGYTEEELEAATEYYGGDGDVRHGAKALHSSCTTPRACVRARRTADHWLFSALAITPRVSRLAPQELEAATEYYGGDGDVRHGAQRLRRMYEAVSGQSAGQLPRGLTEDTLCAALNDYFDVSIALMRRLVEDVTDRGQSVDNPLMMQEIMMRFTREQDAVATDALAAYGMHSEMVGPAIEKFKGSDKVMGTFAACQQRQQTEFAALGLPL